MKQPLLVFLPLRGFSWQDNVKIGVQTRYIVSEYCHCICMHVWVYNCVCAGVCVICMFFFPFCTLPCPQWCSRQPALWSHAVRHCTNAFNVGLQNTY